MNNIIKKYIGESSLLMLSPDDNRHCDDFLLR